MFFFKKTPYFAVCFVIVYDSCVILFISENAHMPVYKKRHAFVVFGECYVWHTRVHEVDWLLCESMSVHRPLASGSTLCDTSQHANLQSFSLICKSDLSFTYTAKKKKKKVSKKHNAYFMHHVLLQNDQLQFNCFGHYSLKM